MNERIEMLKKMVEKSANPVGWIGYHEGHLVSFLQTQEQVNSFLKNTDTAGRVEPVYTHPVKELNDGGEPVKNATYWKRQYNLMATQNDNLKSGLYHANEQIKYLESHPVKEQDESFDRTASHMAGEYVSYKPELTDELNNLKKENKFFKEILSEMNKQVYNIEFLKQPMQILEDGQIVPVFKELTDEEIKFIAYPFESIYTTYDKQTDTDTVHTRFDQLGFAKALLRKAQEK